MAWNPTELSRHFKRPTVLLRASIQQMLQVLLENAGEESLLISCCNKTSFFDQLIHEIELEQKASRESADDNTPIDVEGCHPLLERTIALLSASNRVKVVFCTSPEALHAYLTRIQPRLKEAETQSNNGDGSPTKERMIVVLNVVTLHRTTASYSAQGLGRAFAAIVEAAFRANARLVAVECPIDAQSGEVAAAETSVRQEGVAESVLVETSSMNARGLVSDPLLNPEGAVSMQDHTNDSEDRTLGGLEDTKCENEPDYGTCRGQVADIDCWEEELPILNATTKTFNVGASRDWLERTVKVRDIAARWLSFKAIESFL